MASPADPEIPDVFFEDAFRVRVLKKVHTRLTGVADTWRQEGGFQPPNPAPQPQPQPYQNFHTEAQVRDHGVLSLVVLHGHVRCTKDILSLFCSSRRSSSCCASRPCSAATRRRRPRIS